MKPIADPLAAINETEGKFRSSFWWALPAHKRAREAKEWVTVRNMLAANDWREPTTEDRKIGLSLTAWRALWAKNSFEWLSNAIDEGILPEHMPLDWWASTYWRARGLREVFMPAWPIPTGQVQREIYDQQEAHRQALSDRLLERWPHLLDWHMAAAHANVNRLYSHPLIIAARPGSERLLSTLLQWEGFEPLVEPRADGSVLATPGQLLSLALSRRNQPLLEFALAKGATPDGPSFDYKGNERSLLHEALLKADPHARDWLLDQGAKLETWDRFARTPFLVAARMADVESMEKLLANGADIHATDRFGQNAVHLVIEGLRTTITDTKYLRETGQYRNLDKSPEEIEQSLQRAVQALIFLGKAGVDLDAQAKETPKNTKKSPSPYASLPRAPRSALSASPGERWTDHLARRQAEDRLLPDSTLPRFKEGLLEVRLAAVLPPEPEELSLEPVLDVPVPRVARRPRL